MTTIPAPSIGARPLAGRRVLVLLAVFGLVAVSCGSAADSDGATTETLTSETTTSETATSEGPSGGQGTRLGSLIDGALDPANAPTSGRFTGSMAFEGDGSGGGEFAMEFEGAYDLEQQAMEIELDLTAMMAAMADSDEGQAALQGMETMFEEPMQMRSIGADGWIKWSFFTIVGAGSGKWVHMDAADLGGLSAGFGVSEAGTESPMAMLATLREAEADIVEVGRESVQGVDTTHYEVTIDAEARADLAEVFSDGTGALEMDVWIGDDGLVYRWSTRFDSSSIAGAEGVDSITMTYEFSDYGADVGIVAPDPADVVEGDDLGF